MTDAIATFTPLQHPERLSGVEPELVAFCLRVPKILGGRWRVVRGVTSDKEQSALYAKGRTVVGERATAERPLGSSVTEAQTAAQSAHGMRKYGGCAVDLVAMNDDDTCDWEPARYEALGSLAQQMGLEWGGNFTVTHNGKVLPMHDNGHVGIRSWRSIPLKDATT